MLVSTKARVGVFSIALGAYLPQFPSLVPEFDAQYAAFKKTISGILRRISTLLCQRSFCMRNNIVETGCLYTVMRLW